MAKYTELFAEYLQDGGALPTSSFALIEGFEDLFKERFCDCEIGYETPALFAIKLDARAKVVMPLYADKLTIVEAQIAKLKTDLPKTRNEERIYGKQHNATESPKNSPSTMPIARNARGKRRRNWVYDPINAL